jgi:hypothetical protein
MAVILRACGILEPLQRRIGLASKSTDTLANIKKQPDTNQEHQRRVPSGLWRALDRKSAIVTVLLK